MDKCLVLKQCLFTPNKASNLSVCSCYLRIAKKIYFTNIPEATDGTPDEPDSPFLEEVRRDDFLPEEDDDARAPDDREDPETLLIFFLFAF